MQLGAQPSQFLAAQLTEQGKHGGFLLTDVRFDELSQHCHASAELDIVAAIREPIEHQVHQPVLLHARGRLDFGRRVTESGQHGIDELLLQLRVQAQRLGGHAQRVASASASSQAIERCPHLVVLLLQDLDRVVHHHSPSFVHSVPHSRKAGSNEGATVAGVGQELERGIGDRVHRNAGDERGAVRARAFHAVHGAHGAREAPRHEGPVTRARERPAVHRVAAPEDAVGRGADRRGQVQRSRGRSRRRPRSARGVRDGRPARSRGARHRRCDGGCQRVLS